MLNPLKQFVCDTCGHLIKEPKHGYVQWECVTDTQAFENHRFSIVHQKGHSPMKDGRDGGCYLHMHGGMMGDISLTEFTNPNTVMGNLLFFLDLGPRHQPEYEGPSVAIANLRNYVELVRRLTIPYYEEARQYWDEALEDGFFFEQNEFWGYDGNNLKQLIKIYGDDRFEHEQ